MSPATRNRSHAHLIVRMFPTIVGFFGGFFFFVSIRSLRDELPFHSSSSLRSQVIVDNGHRRMQLNLYDPKIFIADGHSETTEFMALTIPQEESTTATSGLVETRGNHQEQQQQPTIQAPQLPTRGVKINLVTEASDHSNNIMTQKDVRYPTHWKDIKSQMDQGNRTAGQSMLDFAITGFPKCGTSSMMYWLGSHPEVEAFQYEVTVLQKQHPSSIIKKIYNGLPEGPFIRGYKSPNDIENLRSLNLLSECFPKTKLLVGLRHPVKWYESFYNFRVQNGIKMPAPEEMKPRCVKGQNTVCIDRGNFHRYLAKMFKTNLTEDEITPYFDQRSIQELRDLRVNGARRVNQVFVYDTEQLGDMNEDRGNVFRKAVQEYLGLNQDLPPMIHFSPGHSDLSEEEQAKRNALKMNICDSKLKKQRNKLVKQGQWIGVWVREYFLQNEDVHVGNMEHFLSILDSYGQDPCAPDGTKLF